jgi:hypothetical protein
MATIIVYEGDGHTVRVEWLDGDGDPVTPATARYRDDCVTTGIEMVPWTSIAATQTVVIDIPGTANVINSPANESETRQITVQANYGQANQRTITAEYVVPNNNFVS